MSDGRIFLRCNIIQGCNKIDHEDLLDRVVRHQDNLVEEDVLPLTTCSVDLF
jgi:hypothetical protein